MPDLTPAAKSVLDAFQAQLQSCTPSDDDWLDDDWQRKCAAAALRAAVDQVLPYEGINPLTLRFRYRWRERQWARLKLFALAADIDPYDYEVDDA